MNKNSEKNLSGNPDSLNRDITDDQMQNDTRLQDGNRQGPLRSASSGAVDMQFATSLDKVTMPTPEAAKMARYADFPVSPSLGTADISIPIYEINTGRLRLPISLQYSTSGIRVSEISGPVGLGWHLNAGGVITRTITGVMDNEPGYLPVGDILTETFADAQGHITDGDNDTLSRHASGQADTHYDRYSYSFLGHTGAFIIRDNVIVTLTPTDLKIESMPGSTPGFKITDTHGTIYEFTKEETSSKYVLSSSPTPLAPSNTCGMGFPTDTPTSWHLTSIRTMDGLDSITLHYDNENEDIRNEDRLAQDFVTMRESHHKTYQFAYKYIRNNNGLDWKWKALSGYAYTYAEGVIPDITHADWRYQIYEGYAPRMLTCIGFRGGTVRLKYRSNNLTYTGSERRSYRTELEYVEVTSAQGRRVVRSEMTYAPTATGDGRKLLTGVTFRGTDGSITDFRTMEYHDSGTAMLPQAQDLFGYYNGATGNTTLVPFRLFPDQFTITESVGDRSYNADRAKALSLKSVTTGGGSVTQIYYEGNSVTAPSGLPFSVIGIGVRVSRIVTGLLENGTVRTVRTRRFLYSDPQLTIPAYAFTHNRFICVSEHCQTIGTTLPGTWEGLYSPERTCTVTIGDQSSCGGAPLESAMIVYGRVSERIEDPAGTSWQRTELTFNTAACIRDTQYEPVQLPDSHDILYEQGHSSGGWLFHLLQRAPSRIPRTGGLQPSVDFSPVTALYIEGNMPMMTMPVMTRTFTKKPGTSETLISSVATTYESAYRSEKTGYTVRSLLSVNATPGHQDTDCMCLADYQQTEFHTRVTLARVVTEETVTYRDGTTDPASTPSDIARAVRVTYSYEGGTRTGENTGMTYPSRSVLSSVPSDIYTLSPRTVVTEVLNHVQNGSSWQETVTERYTRHIVFPDEFTGVETRAEVRGLRNRHYIQPVGEELFYGSIQQATEIEAKCLSFQTLSLGGRTCIMPHRLRTYRNREPVSTDLTISAYDSKGNPVEIQEPDMPVRSYIWGHDGLYPIAEMTGIRIRRTASDPESTPSVSDHLSDSARTAALESSTVPDSVTSAIAGISALEGVLVTSGTYTTLVGPGTVSDPMGVAAISTYDTAGRLSSQRRRGAGVTGSGDLVTDWLYDFMRSDNVTNSIRQRTYTSTGASTSTARTAVTRFDGMGRTVQSSLVGASPSGGDIVTSFVPDFLDREDAVTYLPYREASSNAGAYRSNALSSQVSFYNSLYGTDMGQRAFSRKIYEPSKRNKVEATVLPGHDPDGTRTVTTVEGIGSSEVVKISTNATATAAASSIIRDGHWSAGSLVKTTKTGPDGSVTQVFSNALGSTVLERRLISGSLSSSPVWSSTYYVRDVRDRVECVVTPDEYDALVSGSATSRSATKCYVYRYDSQDRICYRRLPQSSPTYIEYDDAGRVTKETTGNRTFSNEYDSLGRLLKRKYRYGASGTEITLIEYGYDIYDPSQMGGLSFSAVSGIVASGDIMSRARGMKTREKVLVLKPEYGDSEVAAGSTTSIYRAFYYDKLGRLVQTAERNILGQTCRVSTKYDFTGNAVLIRETRQTVSGSGNEVSADTALTYDREGRITGMSLTLSPVTASASYGYDAIGRPVSRTLGSAASPAAVITDSYTIQGWLSQRSSIPFTSQLSYEGTTNGNTPDPGLAGNIMKWKTFRNGSTANGSTYAFTYDLMSRLKSSSRYAGNSATATNPYTEKDITYFADSRIKTMKRYGASASSVQDLSFATDSNTYDAYRNVTNDASSGTTIEWNILNLPRKMTTSGGIVSEYTYLADGTKIRMKSETTTWHYLGSMVFSQAGSASPVFESMAFSEGRIVVNSSGSKEVHYHISDHLGSVRSVVKADGTVIAANDYYPYGKRINTASATAPTQRDRHTFSGKEDQALTPGGAPYLDFGARMYSAKTGKWLSVDPMAEKYYGIGTHVYCAGNPVNLVDPDGRDARVSFNSDEMSIKISCNVFIYGNLANDKLANAYQDSLLSSWGSFTDCINNGTRYTIQWDINVSVMSETDLRDFTTGENNYLEVSDTAETSLVRNKHEGVIRPIINGNNDMLHEFGHLLGLKDRYIKSMQDGKIKYTPQENYEGNIMAEKAGMGVVEPQNILEVLKPFFDAGAPDTYILNLKNRQK